MSVSSWIRRQFNNGVITTAQLNGSLGAGVTSTFAVGSGQGSTFPDGSIGSFIVTIDQGTAVEERILCSSRSSDTFTIASGGRGYNGYTAQSHNSGAFVLHTVDQQDFDEANQVAHQTLGAIAASGDLLVGSGANALSKLSRGAANTFLQTVGSTLQWTAFGVSQSQNVGTANSDGVQTTPARSDHVHALTNAVGLTTATYDPASIAMQVLGTTATQTTSNKRITKRVVTVTQSATPTINTDNTDVASITGLAQAITSMSTNLSGTPNDGDQLIVRITDNGTAWGITWGASFEAGAAVPLPVTTVVSTMLTVVFQWDAATTKWRPLSTDDGSSGWIAPGFQNSWANAGAPQLNAGYRRQGNIVRLRGAINTGSAGTVAFTLPAGYQPQGTVGFPAFAPGNAVPFGFVNISSAGAVSVTYPSSTTSVFLDGITFTVD